MDGVQLVELNSLPGVSKTQQNKTKVAAKSQGETKSGPTEPTEDEKQKTKFNEFWEIVKDMNKKDINNKITSLKESQKDVKNMLTEFQKLLDKSGPYVPSFKA